MLTVRVPTTCRVQCRLIRGRGHADDPDYLAATLESIRRSDIPREAVHVYQADHAECSPAHMAALAGCEFAISRVPWAGFYESYIRAVKTPVMTPWLLVLEDDVVVAPDIYSKALAFIDRVPGMRLGSLFRVNTLTKQDWLPANNWACSQAVLMHHTLLDMVPSTWQEFVHRRPARAATMPFPCWDIIIGETCGADRIYVHRPSLVEHIGDLSSWSGNYEQPKAFK